ncbi:MAG: hypothetical protein JXA09_09880 [Anaerolineae bacterium]|nr:hypothetical protein [Anaerolineae bacterium]
MSRLLLAQQTIDTAHTGSASVSVRAFPFYYFYSRMGRLPHAGWKGSR